MYDIRQFKPSLYLVVFMGITGFALAVRSPGLWLLSAAAALFNAWLVKSGRFVPLPRFVANLGTMLALLWAVVSVREGTTAIIAIGNFLVVLQLVKLYEQRGNRDYAQLLVLSLLLMVAAAINTASLVFGLLFIAYLFVSLYCCLLFHLKVEADNAKALMLGGESKSNPTTISQDQRFLPSSMRRLTALVSAVAIAFAVAVFLFFPRGTGAGLLAPLQIQFAQPMTGFSEQMGYNQVARISQNNEMIAYVSVWRDDEPITEGELLLRGVTYDRYTGPDEDGLGPWQWERAAEPEPSILQVRSGTPAVLDSRESATTYRQQWTYVRGLSHTHVLFALGGVMRIHGDRDFRVRYSPYSQTLSLADPAERPGEYTIISRGVVSQPRLSLRTIESFMGRSPEARKSRIAPEVAEYARRPEVSGSNAAGPLAAQRPIDAYTHSLDLDIARAVERHLQDTFAYTLDLTDTRRTAGEDPIIGFLTEYKKGHCEYFAGAMTLLCQSLGLQARLVAGFKTDEYNEWQHRFVVRQAHAHAWVEVLSPEGVWVTFDPTSGNDPRFQRQLTWWDHVKHLFDFLEHKWADSVVAYDSESRANLITQVDHQLTNTAISGNLWLRSIKTWLDEKLFWTVSSTLLGALMWGMAGAVFVAIAWFFYERWKLNRRAERIGLDALPGSERLRLVRQLGFYDDLMRLLARHQIERPPHLTPLEFAQSLSYLPSEAYHGIRRLTQIFYRIRYGRATLQVAQRRRLQAVLQRISESIDPGAVPGPR